MKLESFEVKEPLPAVGSPVSVDAPKDTEAHEPPVVVAGGVGKVPVGNAAPFAQYQKGIARHAGIRCVRKRAVRSERHGAVCWCDR